MTGRTTASPSLLTRLICGVQGPGDVEWHGMNMLTFGYDVTDDAHHITIRPIDTTVDSSAGQGGPGKAGVDSSAVTYASADGFASGVTTETVLSEVLNDGGVETGGASGGRKPVVGPTEVMAETMLLPRSQSAEVSNPKPSDAFAVGQQATDRVTRESVMESLRRRTDERLRRRHATNVGVRPAMRSSDADGRSLT